MACHKSWEKIILEQNKIAVMGVLLKFSMTLIFVLVLIVLFIIGPRIESVLYPIVPDFRVEKHWTQNGRYFVSGSMVKDRPECDPKDISMFAGGGTGDVNSKPIFIDFKADIYHVNSSIEEETQILRTRPAGAQKWGPWELFPPSEPVGPIITVTALHHCHMLWSTPSTLAILGSSDVFPDKFLDQ